MAAKKYNPREELDKFLTGDFRDKVTNICFAILDELPEWLSKFLKEHEKNVHMFPERDKNVHYQAAYMSKLVGKNPADRQYIITRSPFIISDFGLLAVFMVGDSTIEPPRFETFGASANKITMCLLNKADTIGDLAKSSLIAHQETAKLLDTTEELEKLIDQISYHMGDSVEKTILLNNIFHQIDTLKQSGVKKPK